jgi:hypothetical protein
VIDRVIQQAVLQRLQPLWDPTFSEHSYGFRPGRSAQQAVAQAQAYASVLMRTDPGLLTRIDPPISILPIVVAGCSSGRAAVR